jgi:3-oxoadipate enol-lactonase / 4-carboxymuconolactone decarboxylase
MPFVTVNQTRLFYRLEGNRVLPVLVLSHSIGTDHAMWRAQVQDLLPHFQVLRYDTRGHGASEAPPGEYSVEQLGRDVLGLVEALKLSQFAFCGLSLGGTVGQWLAAHAPERITGLILANTSPRIGSSELWSKRISAVQQGGMAAIVDFAMQRFFSPESFARSSADIENIRSVFLGTEVSGYMGCCAALRDFDFNRDLAQIRVPTLVIAGDQDVSTPWKGNGEILVQGISNARVVHLSAAHLSNIEAPKAFTTALFAFLQPREASSADVLKAGLAVRRKVLGDAHVDRAIAGSTAFTEDLQDLITRYAWGTIWTRPGLDHRTRRLLVLAMMASLGRWEEFRLHVSAGLRHGLEICDIKEALLQTAVYAGVPAANTGFHIAQEEIEKRSAAADDGATS